MTGQLTEPVPDTIHDGEVCNCDNCGKPLDVGASVFIRMDPNFGGAADDMDVATVLCEACKSEAP